MMAQPSGDWSIFKQSFAEHWEAFHTPSHATRQPPTMAWWPSCWRVASPEQMGSVADRCLHCGQGTHRVAMSCTSSLCLRCAKVSVDNWVSQVSQRRHAGVIYRHIILTVLAMFRTTFSQNAAVLWRAFRRCGGQGLDDCSSTGRGKVLRGGDITVLHTHGRHGPSHPHRHLIATSGGDDGQGERWEPRQYLPYELLRRTWPWHLLSPLRKARATDAIKQLVDVCFRTYPNGWGPTCQRGRSRRSSRVWRAMGRKTW